jgi:hypothetical protein
LKAEAKAGDRSGRFYFHGAETNDYFANASPDAAKSAPDDLQKKLNPFDKEAAARGNAFTFGTEKDTATGAVSSYNYTADGAPNSNGTLFDLKQKTANVGPSANLNASNNVQNNVTNRLYRDRLDEYSAATTVANQPAAAPPPPAPAPVGAATDLKQSAQAAPPEQGRASGGAEVALQRRATPTRAVVPAEEARNKKAETIPAHATPQATEETVAVVGKAQDVDSAHAAASGAIAEREVHESQLSGRDAALLTLSPGVAPTGAITGWRVHRGRLLGKLYGIWHDLILRKLQTAGENSVTEISSALESGAGLRAKSQTGATNEKASAVSGGVVGAQQHFASVTSLGSDVWALEVVSQGQSQLVVHHSRDAGITWQPSTLTAPETLKPNSEAGIKFKDAQQGEITLPTGEKWQTTDGGAHWNLVK